MVYINYHHINGQMHMYMIASSVKIISKRNVFAMYQLKSPGWFHVETYMHVLSLWFADTAAAKIVTKLIGDESVDHFHHVLIHLTNYEICNILCLN